MPFKKMILIILCGVGFPHFHMPFEKKRFQIFYVEWQILCGVGFPHFHISKNDFKYFT